MSNSEAKNYHIITHERVPETVARCTQGSWYEEALNRCDISDCVLLRHGKRIRIMGMNRVTGKETEKDAKMNEET